MWGLKCHNIAVLFFSFSFVDPNMGLHLRTLRSPPEKLDRLPEVLLKKTDTNMLCWVSVFLTMKTCVL